MKWLDMQKEVIYMAEYVGEKGVLKAINRVFLERIKCRNEEELGKVCLEVAQELSGSKFGYIGELNEKGLFDIIALSNPGWDACNIPKGEATLSLRDMPIRGIDRSTLREGKSRIINGEEAIEKHPDHVPIAMGGHPPLTAFLGVPFFQEGKVIGMIALANKDGGYTVSDQGNIEALSVAMIEAIKSKRADDALQRSQEDLQKKVRELEQAMEKLREQQKAFMEVSVPVVSIWNRILLLPLIGGFDSKRAQLMMETLLAKIEDSRAKVAILDISGIPVMDALVAQYLLRTVSAARLMGTECIITGIKTLISQTIVHLGVDLSGVLTKTTLDEGIRKAFELTEMKVVGK